MKKKEFFRVLKYTLCAASAGLIQIGTFTLLNELAQLDYWLSYFIALVLSVLWNFTFNRKFTFQSANNIPIAMALVAAYYAVFTPLSVWAEHYLCDTLGWNEYLVTAMNMLCNFVTEYLYQRLVVFRKTIDTKPLAHAKDHCPPDSPSQEDQ